MSETRTIYTGMPAKWSEDMCLDELENYLLNDCTAPFRKTVDDIVTKEDDCRVLVITFTVSEKNLGEHRG